MLVEQRRRDLKQLLSFLRGSVTEAALLSSRQNQAWLDSITSLHFFHQPQLGQLQQRGRTVYNNPYPILALERTRTEDQGISYIHHAFQLKGMEYFYWFPIWRPVAEVPDYLRPEDVIPSGTFTRSYPPEAKEEIRENLGISDELIGWLDYIGDERVISMAWLRETPFNVSLHRVFALGGEAQLYNYNTQSWESSGEGEYRPNLRMSLHYRIKQLIALARSKPLFSFPKLPSPR